MAVRICSNYGKAQKIGAYLLGKHNDLTNTATATFAYKFAVHSISNHFIKLFLDGNITYIIDVRGLLEKYPTFGREKETGLLGALDT